MAGYIGTKAALLSTTTASVGGDSTVGGDLTVDTNTLHVDSANNRVGIGNTSPTQALDVTGDIITSGGVYLGGTGSANKLDDYEEGGISSPYLGDASGNNLYSTYGSAVGSYVKVGQIVMCNIWISANASNRNFTGATAIRLHGLPFSVNATSSIGYNAVAIWPFSGYTGGDLPICRTQVGSTQLVLQQTNVSTGAGSELFANDLTANINWMFSVRYRT